MKPPRIDRDAIRRQVEAIKPLVGVIVLGGQENALSVTRALGSIGVDVCLLAGKGCYAHRSRFCAESIMPGIGETTAHLWQRKLLSEKNPQLAGRVIFPCSDEAIEFVANNEDHLRERYVLEEASAMQRRTYLDKMETLKLARRVGTATPGFWEVNESGQLAPEYEAEIRFPVMVKPIHSHEFVKHFGRKLFIVEDGLDKLRKYLSLAAEKCSPVMVVEMIPGPDTQLSSYYTYRTDDGRSLYGFTKQIIRRYPENSGAACLHETKALEETCRAGEDFFEKSDLRGIGNIEFKRDMRDGRLKIIEVNARMTAAQELVRRSGIPMEVIVYAHLTGQVPPNPAAYEEGLRFWYPARDFKAYLEQRKSRGLSFWKWVQGFSFHRRVYPFFSWSDPMPAIASLGDFLKRRTASR